MNITLIVSNPNVACLKDKHKIYIYIFSYVRYKLPFRLHLQQFIVLYHINSSFYLEKPENEKLMYVIRKMKKKMYSSTNL